MGSEVRNMHVLVEASYMNSHWCSHYLRGITAQAKRKNMPVSVHTTTEFLDDPSFNDTHVIVLGSSLTWASRSMNLLYSRDVRPIVLAVANYQKQFPFASFITMDYDDATRKLMKFLHAGGRTRTAFFSGNTKSSTDMQKVANYLQEGGREQDIFHFEGTLRETTDRLLARIDEFDSVLCANDVSAVVLMKRLESLGFNLPDDMHIVSFGDTVLANLEIHNIAVAKVKSVEAGKLAISAYRLLKSNPSISSASMLLHCDIYDYHYDPVDIKLEHTRMLFDRHVGANFFRDPDVERVLLVEKLVSGRDKLDIQILREVISKESYSKIAAKLFIAENTISYRIKKILAGAPGKSKEEIFDLLSEFLF